jgi:hypothetical protein
MGSGASGRGERGEELLALAGAALGRGDWAGARDAYRQVLEGGESAAVLEGLAHACWWLQEDATTVDCRRRAAHAVHRGAHGLVADEIFEVRGGV